MNDKERQVVFREELKKLQQHDYISPSTFEVVSHAYSKFLEPEVEERAVNSEHIDFSKEENQLTKPQRKRKEKKVKSAQELRDRNLTWILIIGVVFLLLGGLVLATSTWEVLTSAMKTALIGGVSFLFFGISWLSGHKLKIEKTAFAFLVLGSLFLPIVIVSAGYFELFGSWLSISGEGKYVLGLLGTLICLPLYSYQALRQNSRLFVWFSFIVLTVGTSFFIQLFNPTIDAFYFGIVLFNGLLILAYVTTKKYTSIQLFTDELPLYLQGNLVLSTLLMLFFYDQEVFYSFNVILTAFLYLTMVYVGKQKEYHFVFTTLFVYGMYQLIEHSFLESFDVLFYSLIGFVFIGLQMLERFENDYMKRAFQFTSGVVSICAFLFISYKGLFLRFDDPSWLLVAGYLLISLNYIYLAIISRVKLFGFLAPIFFVAAGFYSLNLLYDSLTVYTVMVHLFAIGLILYLFGFYWNKWKYTEVIKTGSLFVSFGPMVLAILIGMVSETWIVSSVLMGIVGTVFFTISYKGDREWIRAVACVGNPIAWAFSLLILYPYWSNGSFYKEELGLPFHLGAIAFALIGCSYVWKKRYAMLSETSFWTGQAAYLVSLLLLLIHPVNELYTRTGLLLGAIFFLYLLFKKTKEETLWFLVSLATLGAYLSAAKAFPIQGAFQWIPGSIVLILIADTLVRKSGFIRKSYFYLAHLYLPVALYYTMLELNDSPLLYFAALLIYFYSILTRTKEWEVCTLLYAGFTVLPFLYLSLVDYYNVDDVYLYRGFAASIVMFVLWFVLNEEWKDRIKWYVVPFSIVGMVPFTLQYEGLSFTSFSIALIYVVMVLYVMHASRWQLLTVIPLLFVLMFVQLLPIETIEWTIVIVVGGASILLGIGLFIYKQLYSFQSKDTLDYYIDWYSVSALLLVFTLTQYPDSPALWAEELPALFVVILLALQIKRVPGEFPSRVVKSLTAVSTLIPYYTLMDHLQLNQYIVTEVYVLPWIALTVYLSQAAWKEKERIVRWAEWGVLSIVAAILVTDAMISNTIYDAIIAGGLSLVSVLAGFYFRIKSYFLIGVSVLLLNLFIQTRPYWGNMPWWAYLLIVGFTLITVASFYEWQKQKKDDQGSTFLQVKKEQLVNKWKEWK